MRKLIYMKNLVFVLFFVFNLSFAHKDHIAQDSCGKTKIFMRSAFKYAEFNKTKVIVQIIDKVAKELNYNEDILIEYNHQIRRYYSEKDEVFLEYRKFRKENYLKIKIIDSYVDIENLIKLVEFAIKNKTKLKSFKFEIDDFEFETNYKIGSHFITNTKIIDSLNNQKLNEKYIGLLNSKIEIFHDEFFQCYWLKNKYYYLKNDMIETLYSIEDNLLFSNELTSLGLVIFHSNSQFFFINNNGEILKNHSLEEINNSKVFYFFERRDKFYVTSDREIGYYYLPDLDKLLKVVN